MYYTYSGRASGELVGGVKVGVALLRAQGQRYTRFYVQDRIQADKRLVIDIGIQVDEG